MPLELKKVFESLDFKSDPQILETYGRDWTRVYTPNPCGVVFPRSTEEVLKITTQCVKHKLPIVPSGGRTGLSGGAVAHHQELVVSFEKMNRIGKTDPLSQTVRVQAGAITEAVHLATAQEGLTWPVDFASKGSSQVGGNISTNAGGVRVIRYGMTRNWVLGLQVVTLPGKVLELNGALEKNNTGPDLRQFFIGSEGILGLITEATLKLTKLPKEANVFFFALSSMEQLLELFLAARKGPFELTAFEMMTNNCLEAVLELKKLSPPFQTKAPYYALVEVERPHTDSDELLFDQWLEALFSKSIVVDGLKAQSPREIKELWFLRESITEGIIHRGFPHKNDIAVPISELVSFTKKLIALFNQRKKTKENFEAYIFGHIGDGNLHINTPKPKHLDKEEFIDTCHKLDQDLFVLVQSHQGSISAEHGIGLLKKEALQFSRSPQEIEYLKSLKKVFDPEGLLNPGKVF